MPFSDMAGAPKADKYWMTSLSSTPSRQNPCSLPSSRSSSVHPTYEAFDIEVVMAQSLITSDPDPNARPKHFQTLFEECLFVFMVMMATASTTFLQGVVVINTATIGRDLNMTPAQMTWISAAIGLASGAFMLFFGKTADLIGCKLQLLAGLAFLSITSLGTAFVPNPTGLNILCGFLGLGTAVISPPAIGTLFATYPEGRRRNMATGALGCGNPIGFILGSVSSGIATKYSSWRASFVVITIFFAMLAVSSFWTMPSTPRAGSLGSEARKFDYLGTVLTVVGFALVSAGLTEGPALGWDSLQVVIMLLFGVFSLIAFALWEDYYPLPLLNPAVWKNRTYTLCILCVFFGYMSFITNLFWISLYMQEVQHLSGLQIAVRLLPQALVGFIWSYVGQALVSKIPGKLIMGIGGFAYLVGATLQIFVRHDTSYWLLLFPALCITVIGADFQFIVSNLYISKQMPSQSSLAAGVLQTAMRVSISIGLAISSAVYGSVAQTPMGKADVDWSFEHAYLCSILFAAISLLFIPFMVIERQGTKSISPLLTGRPMLEEDRPRTAAEYPDHISMKSQRHIITPRPSQTSLWSSATVGSVNSFFPRWSWEPEITWPDDRHQHRSSNVVYEVCVKCLEERVVVVQPNPVDLGNRPQTLDPNPFRRIKENCYSDLNDPVVDREFKSSEAVYINRAPGTVSFDSTETLANSRPPSRAQSQRHLSPTDARISKHGITNSNFSSTKTLRPQMNDPMFHRTPARRGTVIGSLNNYAALPSFPAPPHRSTTMPIQKEDMTMSGARVDQGSDINEKQELGHRVSGALSGWV